MAKLCLMVLSGPVSSGKRIQAEFLTAKPVVIGVDGGFDVLHGLGIQPSLSIGDFDSTDYPLDQISYMSLATKALDTHKDQTDFEAAMADAFDAGYRFFEIYGALGGSRLDLELSNWEVCHAYALKGARIRLVSPDGTTDAEILSSGMAFDIPDVFPDRSLISVISLAEESQVDIQGLAYGFKGTLTNQVSLGVSNRTIKGKAGSVICQSGVIVIFHPSL